MKWKFHVRCGGGEKPEIKTKVYLFLWLTKPQIRKIFEKLFNVNILSVNTHLAPMKKKRLGLKQGYKTRYKRAIIKIKADQKIPIFSNDD